MRVTLISGDDPEAIARAAWRLFEALGERRVVVLGSGLPGRRWRLGVEIEARIVYRTPGCACCAFRGDLIDALGELSIGPARPEWVIVLEPPGADPLIAVQTFLADPMLRASVLLDGLITTADARVLSSRLSSADELEIDRPIVASWSSTIVLEGLERLTSSGKGRVIRALHVAAPLANVALSGAVTMAVGRRLLDPSATNALIGEAGRHGGPVLEFRSGLDPVRARAVLQALIDAQQGQLPMLLASLSFAGMMSRLVVHGARAYLESQWLSHTKAGEVSRLLVLGEGVDRAALRRDIASVYS